MDSETKFLIGAIAAFIANVLIVTVISFLQYSEYYKMQQGYQWVPEVQGHWELRGGERK